MAMTRSALVIPMERQPAADLLLRFERNRAAELRSNVVASRSADYSLTHVAIESNDRSNQKRAKGVKAGPPLRLAALAAASG
jgi:hypothetical protein